MYRLFKKGIKITSKSSCLLEGNQKGSRVIYPKGVIFIVLPFVLLEKLLLLPSF